MNSPPDSDSAQIENALIGEAVRLLSEIGAPVDVLGAFAARYPAMVQKTLGGRVHAVSQKAPVVDRDAAAVDLEAVVHSMMTKVIKESGLIDKTASQKPGRVTINVLCGGRRTSVKVRASLIDQMNAVTGSLEDSQKIIKEIAGSAPEDAENRSAYVNEQIKHYLLLSAADSRSSPSQH